MARRKSREGQSLHKVLGVPALFSTAYGNVGSSIYYALGVVAAYAMGLTPVVFTLTGMLFVTTAWSYAEATAMLPEAGGSSSFTRRAFNEFVSFGAGWALMLDYIVTIAISAFFVPNYLAVFWPVLRTWPYNSIGGIVVILALVVVNVVGIKEAARLNIVLAVADLGTQVLIMVLGRRAPSGATAAHRPGGPLDVADPAPVHLRDLHRHDRLHRHRDDLEHVGGGGEPRSRRPARHQHGARHGDRRLHRDVARRALRHARRQQRGAGGPAHRLRRPGGGAAGRDRRHLRARRRPVDDRLSPGGDRRRAHAHARGRDEADGRGLHPRRRRVHQDVREPAGQQLHRGPGAGGRALHPGRPGLAPRHPRHLGRRARGDHPRHRHQRGTDRRVPPRLLAGPAPAGAPDPRPRPPEAHDPVHLHHRVRCRGLPHHHPGQYVLPRGPLRLRGDDLVHRRAHLRRRSQDQGARPEASVPHASQHPVPGQVPARCCRSSAASARSRSGASWWRLMPRAGSSASPG